MASTLCGSSGTRQVIRSQLPGERPSERLAGRRDADGPDGWAIIGPHGHPVELMSYEGTSSRPRWPRTTSRPTSASRSGRRRARRSRSSAPATACGSARTQHDGRVQSGRSGRAADHHHSGSPDAAPVGFQTQSSSAPALMTPRQHRRQRRRDVVVESAPSIISVDANSGILTGCRPARRHHRDRQERRCDRHRDDYRRGLPVHRGARRTQY